MVANSPLFRQADFGVIYAADGGQARPHDTALLRSVFPEGRLAV
jgi:hypothetical protein